MFALICSLMHSIKSPERRQEVSLSKSSFNQLTLFQRWIRLRLGILSPSQYTHRLLSDLWHTCARKEDQQPPPRSSDEECRAHAQHSFKWKSPSLSPLPTRFVFLRFCRKLVRALIWTFRIQAFLCRLFITHPLYNGLRFSIIYDSLEKKRVGLYCGVRNSLSRRWGVSSPWPLALA